MSTQATKIRCICKDTQREITCAVCGKKETHDCQSSCEVEFRCEVHKKIAICGLGVDICNACTDAGWKGHGGDGGAYGIDNVKTGEKIDMHQMKI